MSPWEIATLALLALLIFGPDRLPSMARKAGRQVASLRREARQTLDDLRKTAELEELQREVGVDELRETARELRGEADRARRDVDQAVREVDDRTREPLAAASRRAGADRGTPASDDEAPPYDPDAT